MSGIMHHSVRPQFEGLDKLSSSYIPPEQPDTTENFNCSDAPTGSETTEFATRDPGSRAFGTGTCLNATSNFGHIVQKQSQYENSTRIFSTTTTHPETNVNNDTPVSQDDPNNLNNEMPKIPIAPSNAHTANTMQPKTARNNININTSSIMSKLHDEPFQFDYDNVSLNAETKLEAKVSFTHSNDYAPSLPHHASNVHTNVNTSVSPNENANNVHNTNTIRDDHNTLTNIYAHTLESPSTYVANDKTLQSEMKSIDPASPVTSMAPVPPPKTYRSRKVQPVLYSAIGSLEKVNQQNLGSFNTKVYLASKEQKDKKKHYKHENKQDLNALTLITAPTTTTALSLPQTTHKHIKQRQKKEKLVVENNHKAIKDAKNDHGETTNSNKLSSTSSKIKKKKKVSINSNNEIKKIEMFRPSCDAYTPRIQRKKIKYKPAEERASMGTMSTNTMGTIQKPNFCDALRRVAMIIQQHIVKIERRFESGANNLNLFTRAMRDAFAEENFVTPRYKYSMVNIPMGRAGVVYGMRKIRAEYKIPSADDIYQFGHQLFNQVQLSSECSIICLIYMERLMEVAKVPVMAKTWRPVFMCGLLLASKVWQDWASWNIEFASVYPQFSLDAINKLEVKFCKVVKWDLYISSSLYAKYYFALRSLLEKQDFRRRYVQMVGGVDNVSASEAMMISKRSEMVKEKVLTHLSKSM